MMLLAPPQKPLHQTMDQMALRFLPHQTTSAQRQAVDYRLVSLAVPKLTSPLNLIIRRLGVLPGGVGTFRSGAGTATRRKRWRGGSLSPSRGRRRR